MERGASSSTCMYRIVTVWSTFQPASSCVCSQCLLHPFGGVAYVLCAV